MIFLVDYDRGRGELVGFTEFEKKDFRAAETARLDLELELLRSGISREVVLLEAPSREALRRTHRRYFDSLAEILRSGLQQL